MSVIVRPPEVNNRSLVKAILSTFPSFQATKKTTPPKAAVCVLCLDDLSSRVSKTISRVMSLDGHLSRTAVASSLKQPTRKLTAAICFLFGLASSGVYMCPACYQPGGSLLHCPSTLTCLLSQTGGIFLLHCPWSRLRQTLSGTLPVKPGLSSPAASRYRSSGHLSYSQL